MKKNAEYYFGVDGGKRIEAMSRVELYRGFAQAYQLAGSLLIGSDIREWTTEGPGRRVNGWTEEQVDDAIEVLLNFLSRPYDVHQVDFDRARAAYVRDVPKTLEDEVNDRLEQVGEEIKNMRKEA